MIAISMGSLIIKLAIDQLELLAPKVAEFLTEKLATANIGVAEIDANLSDTAAFCQNYNVSLAQAANCVVLEAKRADQSWFAACVILGSTKADVNGMARRTLDAKKVSFAPMDKAVAHTAMEYGAITPLGLPKDWSILIDKAVADSQYVIVGSGIRKSKLIVPGSILASLPNAQVLEGLGKTIA